jgi:acetoacetyl-CoA synthetase
MEPIWTPSQKQKKESNIQRFINFINEEHRLTLDSYFDLYDWSIKNVPEFWYSIWKFTDIRASKAPREVVDNLNKFPSANWFPDAELNFAENLLRHKDEHLALIFKGETKKYQKLTYNKLYNTVIRLAHSLKELDIEHGDLICGYMPNIIETPIAMLASTSIGATWASCGAELGSQTVIDRLNQINPKILFASDGYLYKGKSFNSLDKIKETIKGIPSLEKIVICPYIKENPDITDIPNSILLSDFVGNKNVNESEYL